MKTKSEKKFQIFAHIVMIILSLTAVIPFLLLVISSFTDNDTLISDGYSFTPAKWSIYAYQYIFKTGNSVMHAY
ncbi:MAG TPA: carbohydrate ABC transporter permease, partial [Lachnospiraceae bacterium]|nr:carbohydrate ABC transporter permease [Lachnospiraceae bacterium]